MQLWASGMVSKHSATKLHTHTQAHACTHTLTYASMQEHTQRIIVMSEVTC